MRERFAWLIRVNVAEMLLIAVCMWAAFSFLVLGYRPSGDSLQRVIPQVWLYVWNLALLLFGTAAMISYFWFDLVTRSLIRLFALGGLSLSVLGYSVGLGVIMTSLHNQGEHVSFLPLVSLFLFFLIFAGSALQIFLTLSWGPKHEVG